jgi:hypothetical protein
MSLWRNAAIGFQAALEQERKLVLKYKEELDRSQQKYQELVDMINQFKGVPGC